MWHQSNWCERAIIISLGVIISLLSFNVFFQQTALGSWLPVYAIFVILFSIWVTCRDIQFLLEQNAPLKGESDDISLKHSKISFLCFIIPIFKNILPVNVMQKQNKPKELKKRSINTSTCSDISMVASVIERKCVWSWYSQYVSKEIAFPFACKELLDQVVTKVFQVTACLDTVNFYSDSLGIILRHCKEYKRAKKRLLKTGQGKIEEYYRNTHPTSAQRNSHTISTKGKSTQSHCLLLTRAFLKELLPWELWGTPHSLLLASVLAKRLDLFIATNLSNPVWLRSKIMKMLNNSNLKVKDKTEDVITELELKLDDKKCADIKNETIIAKPIIVTSMQPDNEIEMNKHDLSVENNIDDAVIKTSIESALSNLISNSTAPILQRAELDDIPLIKERNILQSILPVGSDVTPKSTNSILISKKPSQPIDITSSPSHSFNGHISNPTAKAKGSNEVKIYDRVVEGTVKTWNSDVDLECVSLGQDLLASLDGEMDFESRLGRLWEADGADSTDAWSPNPPSTGSSTKTPQGLWFGEEDNLDMDLTEESPPKNMDEAAGMMEGIFDFGMAGIRKGLRLTGLQESPPDKSSNNKPSDSISNNLVSTIGQALTSSRKNSQTDENAIKSDDQKLSQKGSDSSDSTKSWSFQASSNNHLVKQHHVTSQDNAFFPTTSKDKEQIKDKPDLNVPIVEPLLVGGDSPDYEYEEPADFASTIAKLRSLLQQKTGDGTTLSQDDAVIPSSTLDNSLVPAPRPASATQPTNSPVHKPITMQHNIPTKSAKSEDAVSIPSFESDNGFTILSQNSSDFIEAEEALSHKIGFGSFPNSNSNNMQRLDKLFTRTVTGVFNTIKTAVGGDSLSDVVSGHTEAMGHNQEKATIVRAHQHKDDWIFVEGDVDVSILVCKLLIERRGFCVVEVEAAQDTLEILSGTAALPQQDKQITSPASPVHDDLDESELITGCPLYHMCMELVTVAMGGVMQKNAVVKCTSVLVAEMVEAFLKDKLNTFNSWIATAIIESLRELLKQTQDTQSSESETTESTETYLKVEELSDAIFQKIPEKVFLLFGKEEISAALEMIVTSIDNSLVNRDVIFNLLDVALLHFLKACTNESYVVTPPPSA